MPARAAPRRLPDFPTPAQESCLGRLRAMARLRRSKLAAGFLLLFQCLSERCQLAAEETPSQSNGKPDRDRDRDGDTGLGSGSGLGVAPPPPAASPQRANGVWGPAPPAPEGGPGCWFCTPRSSPASLGRASPSLALFIYFNDKSGLFLPSSICSAVTGAVPFPELFVGSPWVPSRPQRHSPPRGEGLGRERGETPGSPGQWAETPGDPPASPPAATRGSIGKVSLQLLPGHSAPLAQAGSLQPSLNKQALRKGAREWKDTLGAVGPVSQGLLCRLSSLGVLSLVLLRDTC